MHKKVIAKIADELRGIASRALGTPEDDLSSFYMHDGVAYSLLREDEIAFRGVIVEFIRGGKYSEKFSEKYVEKKIKRVFAGLISQSNIDLEKELAGLILEMDSYSENSSVFLRVDGVVISCCLVLGRVKLSPYNDGFLDYFRKRAKIVVEGIDHSSTDKARFTEILESQAVKELSGGCVAIYESVAEPIKALEDAKQEVRRVIDVLRLSSKALYPLSEDIRFGLKGDYVRGERQGFVVSDGSINTKSDSIGSVRRFEIDEGALSAMEEIGAYRIFDALRKKQFSNMEGVLIRGVHWFSVALTQDEIGNGFLFLIIALESLFLKPNGGSIGGTVAESVAFITSDKMDERKKIVQDMREYYSKRSAVAHGGSKDIFEADFYRLMYMCLVVISKIACRLDEISSQKELMSWIDDKKFS